MRWFGASSTQSYVIAWSELMPKSFFNKPCEKYGLKRPSISYKVNNERTYISLFQKDIISLTFY